MKNLSIDRLTLITAGLLVVSVFLGFWLFRLDNSGSEHLDGTYIEPQSEEIMKAIARTLFVSVPIVCLILGAVTSIFINRDVPYRKRYFRGYLYTLGAVYFIYSVLTLSRVVALLVV